jgi:hypothetical protein
LDHNEIFEIHENAFDQLENLYELKLDNNLCIIRDETNVKEIINEVKKNCTHALMEKLTYMFKNVKDLDATEMTLLVVMSLLVFAILIAIVMRIMIGRYEYDLEDSMMEWGSVIGAFEMPKEVNRIFYS